MILHLDFETFSELDVRAVGSCRYAEHPSTEVLCLAWAINDKEPRLWEPSQAAPAQLFVALELADEVHAWNAGFERAIWREVCTPRMGWPTVREDAWRDPGAVAATLGLPLDLDGCARALELPADLEKDKRGKHLINKLSKPRKPSKHNPATRWTPETKPQDFADFYEYCRQDVRVERAVGHALPYAGLSPREHRIWRMTMALNERGWAVDVGGCQAMVALLEKHKAVRLEELAKLTDGAVTTANQRDRAMRWLAERGVELADFTADTLERTLQKDARRRVSGGLPAEARKLIELRLELAKSSTAKYTAILNRAGTDGRVRDNLVYHGAATGRDAGRGIQIQNFPSDLIASGDELDPALERAVAALHDSRNPLRAVTLEFGMPPAFASKMLRPMLVAKPGYDLVAADFSSVENRITVYLAGDFGGIQLFKDGLDQYTKFYADWKGIPYEQVSKQQRTESKPIILGCCFGMGARTFVRTQARYGHTVTLEDAQECVDGYRAVYHDVVKLWYGLRDAALDAVAAPGAKVSYRRITFEVRGDFLYMRLPSSRELAYYKPMIERLRAPWADRDDPNPQMIEAVTCMQRTGPGGKLWRRESLSPGRLTENAVQATSRDLLMLGALNAEEAGYPTVGRVHDELIAEVPEGFGSLDEFIGLLTDVPKWLRGPDAVPIEATGYRAKRFRKD